MIRKAVFAALVVAGAALGATTQASAMPLANDLGASNAQIELARYGCGPGWRPNRWGRCVPAMRPGPRWRGPEYRRHRPMHRPHWDDRRW